jgi:hypothetical protein
MTGLGGPMTAEAKAERPNKVRKSFQLEPDEEAWVVATAAELGVPETWVIRRVVRAAMATGLPLIVPPSATESPDHAAGRGGTG